MRNLSFFILIYFFASIAQAKECKGLKLLGEIISKHRINGKVETRQSWQPLPGIISLHSGEFRKLKVSPADRFDKVSIVYQPSLEDQSKPTQRKSLSIKDGEVEGINFSEWLKDFTWKAKGQITWTLKGKNKNCELVTEVMPGD